MTDASAEREARGGSGGTGTGEGSGGDAEAGFGGGGDGTGSDEAQRILEGSIDSALTSMRDVLDRMTRCKTASTSARSALLQRYREILHDYATEYRTLKVGSTGLAVPVQASYAVLGVTPRGALEGPACSVALPMRPKQIVVAVSAMPDPVPPTTLSPGRILPLR